MGKITDSSAGPLRAGAAQVDINPRPAFDPDYVEDHQHMGRVLAETAAKVIETLTFENEAVLDSGITHLKIPIRELDPKELEQAEAMLSKHPHPIWREEDPTCADPQWMHAAQLMSVHLLREREPELEYEIQVLRVGKTAFVGLPGEPFVEGGLRIKMGSPTYPTYIAHCTTHYVGGRPSSIKH